MRVLVVGMGMGMGIMMFIAQRSSGEGYPIAQCSSHRYILIFTKGRPPIFHVLHVQGIEMEGKKRVHLNLVSDKGRTKANRAIQRMGNHRTRRSDAIVGRKSRGDLALQVGEWVGRLKVCR